MDFDSSPPLIDPFAGWEPAPGSTRTHPAPHHRAEGSTVSRGAWRPQESSPASETRNLGFSLRFDSPPSGVDAVETRVQSPRTPVEPNFPQPGDCLAGFRLVSEIGRGAFARVYRAEQVELAGRSVALKVSRPVGEEPQILARLQHTHIVPIHSVHDDPVSGLRLICMPYLGGANLAQVLDAAEARLPAQATGRSLIEALDLVGGQVEDLPGGVPSRPGSHPSEPDGLARAKGGSPSRVRTALRRYLARFPGWSALERQRPVDPPDSEWMHPARRFFRGVTYLQAAVWIAARLAEALDHAHSRGLLHRDLKPSNVLIAADGTPMLLDFNLSIRIRRDDKDEEYRDEVGGTLPYMAPEHLDAFSPDGSTPPDAVDERSDLYSLGLILFEMVTGRHPFSVPPSTWPLRDAIKAMIDDRNRQIPSARAFNPTVPWSLDAILRRCLDPKPSRRYQTAADLAEDLRRFLEDLPLAFAPEPSRRERVRKWARRHPRLCSASSVGAVAAVLLILSFATAGLIARHYEQAQTRLRWNEFQHRAREAKLLLNTTSGPYSHLPQGIAEANRALALFQVRPRDDWIEQPALQRLSAQERLALRELVSELVILRARAEELESRQQPDWARRTALLTRAISWLDWAATIDPQPPRRLYQLRGDFHAALGLDNEARRDRELAGRVRLRSARDALMTGTDLLSRGRADEAEPLLYAAATEDPEDYWAWFTLGLCQADRGRHLEAAGSFGACTALAPDFAWGFLNRGIELARIGRLTEARRSYDRALQANPNFLEALVNRGLVCLELNQADLAERDLARARALGHRDPALLAAHAEALHLQGKTSQAERQFQEALAQRPGDSNVLLARGAFRLPRDPNAARDDFAQVLSREPLNPRAHLGMAQVLSDRDPSQALVHLDRALDADADLHDALELRAVLRARQGDRAAALDDVERLSQVPTPRRLYNAACAVSILASVDPQLIPKALQLLGRALRSGYPPHLLTSDPDLDPIRSHPEFTRLTRSSKPHS